MSLKTSLKLEISHRINSSVSYRRLLSRVATERQFCLHSVLMFPLST